MKTIRLLGLAGLAFFVACDGLKEALTAHVDVVASAGTQELSVDRLAEMMGKSAQIPLQKETAKSIADTWVTYHLLGAAAIKGDSLSDKKMIDDVLWSAFAQSKAQKYMQKVSEAYVPDTSNWEAAYAGGQLLAARHILFQAPPAADSGAPDTAKRSADGVRARITSANFAALAKQYGTDGTKDQGGDLGVFPPNAMVPEFAAAVAALKPGEIGPLVRTQFGYHIVRRSTYAEVAESFKQQWLARQRLVHDSTFLTKMEDAAKIEYPADLPKTVKAVMEDPDGHASDRTAVAKMAGGAFRASDLVRHILAAPQPDQIRAQIAQAPDSMMKTVVRNLVRMELILKAADSAKVGVDSAERAEVYNSFTSVVQNSFMGLGIAPTQLADSAKTEAERATFVPQRINDYFNRLVNGQAQFVEVPGPVSQALRQKYDWKLNAAGLDRAIQAATAIRAKEDSTRAAAQPKSAVPMPGDTAAKK